MKNMHSSHASTTNLLYLEDQRLREATAKIYHCSKNDDSVAIIVDQTPLYVKRGGQPGDKGTAEGDGFSIVIKDVTYSDSGDIVHTGSLKGRLPIQGDKVILRVDSAVRQLHSLWHSAGEAVIIAAKMADFDKPVSAAIHYGPDQNRIEYQARLDKAQCEQLKIQIEANLEKVIQDNTTIAILNLSEKREVIEQCGFWPDYVASDEIIRVAKVRPDYTGRPCTGTHLERTSELGEVRIEKVKNKGDRVSISYSCDLASR